MSTRRQFRRKQLILRQGLKECRMSWWIGHVDTVGNYAHSGAACGECTPMRGHVDAECATRKHRHAVLDKIGGKVGGDAVAVRGRRPRPDDRHRALHQMRQMSWTTQPQPQRLAAAALDVLGVSKIIQTIRPFVVTGYYK